MTLVAFTLLIFSLSLVLHFIGDFLLQSDWMALNKSKYNEALTAHVLVYSLMFLPFGLHFWAITFALHWLTDWCTSRITSKLWFVVPAGDEGAGWFTYDTGNKRHWFFVMIGLDQLIHALTLIWTFYAIWG